MFGKVVWNEQLSGVFVLHFIGIAILGILWNNKRDWRNIDSAYLNQRNEPTLP